MNPWPFDGDVSTGCVSDLGDFVELKQVKELRRVRLHGCCVARVINGIKDICVEVVGDGVVLIAVVVEQCLVVGLHALSEQGSYADTVSSSEYM